MHSAHDMAIKTAIRELFTSYHRENGTIEAIVTVGRPKGLSNSQTLCDVVNSEPQLILENFDQDIVTLALPINHVIPFQKKYKNVVGDSGLFSGAAEALNDAANVPCYFRFRQKPPRTITNTLQQAVGILQQHFHFDPPLQFNGEEGEIAMNLAQVHTLEAANHQERPSAPGAVVRAGSGTESKSVAGHVTGRHDNVLEVKFR